MCVCLSRIVCVCVSLEHDCVSESELERKMESCSRLCVCVCVLWEFQMHFRLQTLLGPTHRPKQWFLHQFMMQFLFKVMKYTWLLPPDRTDAKNTWGAAQTPRTHVSVTSLNPAVISELTVPHFECLPRSYLVISLTKELQPLSSFVHEDTIQVASLHRTDLNGLFSPSHDLIGADMSCKAKCNISSLQAVYFFFLYIMHPLSSIIIHFWIKPAPTDVGISPHCRTTSLMMRPYVLT